MSITGALRTRVAILEMQIEELEESEARKTALITYLTKQLAQRYAQNKLGIRPKFRLRSKIKRELSEEI